MPIMKNKIRHMAFRTEPSESLLGHYFGVANLLGSKPNGERSAGVYPMEDFKPSQGNAGQLQVEDTPKELILRVETGTYHPENFHVELDNDSLIIWAKETATGNFSSNDGSGSAWATKTLFKSFRLPERTLSEEINYQIDGRQLVIKIAKHQTA